MDWAQFGIMILSFFGIFLWNRSEANADRRVAEADRKDILTLIRAIENEMKDFHHRLLQIERDRK